MSTRNAIANKARLAGARVGLVLFALVGLLHGSLIGGTMGREIVSSLFHEAAGATLLPKFIVAASVLAGVAASGMMSVGLCSGVGWSAGYAIGAAMEPGTRLGAEKGRPN